MSHGRKREWLGDILQPPDVQCLVHDLNREETLGEGMRPVSTLLALMLLTCVIHVASTVGQVLVAHRLSFKYSEAVGNGCEVGGRKLPSVVRTVANVCHR